MSARPWTVAEVDRLREHADCGVKGVAQLLNRTPASVQAKARQEGISLRRPGERRGKVRGESSRGSLPPELRNELLEDPRVWGYVEASRDLRIGRRSICPSCVARPAIVQSTGLCRPCHDMVLVEGHQHHKAARESNRQLQKHKQRAKRARDQVTGETA